MATRSRQRLRCILACGFRCLLGFLFSFDGFHCRTRDSTKVQETQLFICSFSHQQAPMNIRTMNFGARKGQSWRTGCMKVGIFTEVGYLGDFRTRQANDLSRSSKPSFCRYEKN